MKEHYIIEYLNCKKDFQKDSVHFKGTDSYEEAVTWGKKNLENFHLDMIKVVYLDNYLNSSNNGSISEECKSNKFWNVKQ